MLENQRNVSVAPNDSITTQNTKALFVPTTRPAKTFPAPHYECFFHRNIGKLRNRVLGNILFYMNFNMVEGSLEVKLPTIWTDEKQGREEAERRERLEERRVEEKESEERRCRCAKR